MISKYTTAFFGPGILIWLLTARERRAWLATPWPWAAGLIAALAFSPVFIWNAQHQWASFAYQSHRMIVESWSLQFPLELIGAQCLLVTPPILILAGLGIGRRGPAYNAGQSVSILLRALVLPIPLYFLWHSFHERVQANWPEPVFPALCVLAAGVAVHEMNRAARSRLASVSLRFAAPVGIGLAMLAFLQAAFGVIPLGRHDPAGRVLGVGMRELAAQVEDLRESADASLVLVTDYTIGGWLDFYMPSATEVEQVNERIRWIDAPQPETALLRGVSLYVCKGDCPELTAMSRRFGSVTLLRKVDRRRGDQVLNSYSVYRVSEPRTHVLDDVYPAMNLGVRS